MPGRFYQVVGGGVFIIPLSNKKLGFVKSERIRGVLVERV
jgi:hypothetical protein